MAHWIFKLGGVKVDEPIGFDKVDFTAKRMTSHGMDQPFSSTFTFIGKGAKILRSFYEENFINGVLTFEILSNVKVNGSNYIFRGYINFSVYEEEKTPNQPGWQITVGVLEDDFREKFLARQDVEIDLTKTQDLDGDEIDPLEFRQIRMHTQELYLVAKAENFSTQIDSVFYDGTGWTLPDFAITIPAYYDNSDFDGPFGRTFDPIATKYTFTNATFQNNANFARTLKFKLQISGEFAWVPTSGPPSIGDSANIALSFQRINRDGVEVERLYPAVSGVNTWNGIIDGLEFNFDIEVTMVFQPGDRLLIFNQWGSDGNVKVGVWSGGARALTVQVFTCCLSINEANNAAFATDVPTLPIEQMFRRLIYQITGDPDGFVSDTFSEAGEGCYWNNNITNGLRIRNAQTVFQTVIGCGDEDPGVELTLISSFRKLFEGLDSIFCLGWQFEQDVYGKWLIRVESRDYFYNKNQQIAKFRRVSEIKQMAMADKIVNQIVLGYDDSWKNIAIAGQWAIHTDRTYFVGNRINQTVETSKLDIRSTIIGEGQAIEFSRRLQQIKEDSGSSDRPNDNALFIIWTNPFEFTVDEIEGSPYDVGGQSGPVTFAPGTASVSSNFITASDSPVGNLYNIYHTPARIACRWWKVLGMHTYKLADPVLRFQSGQYYTQYASTINGSDEKIECLEPIGQSLPENSDISAEILNTEFQEYLFIPKRIEATVPQNLCDFLKMATPGTGYVELQIGEYNYKGFIETATNNPTDPTKGTTDFVLTLANIPEGLGAYSSGYSDGYDNG